MDTRGVKQLLSHPRLNVSGCDSVIVINQEGVLK